MRLRHSTLTLFGLLGLAALSPIHIQAQVAAAPSLMNFQGRLTKPDGTPVADGTYSVRFSLWNALAAGTETWNQTIASVAVRNGTFSVQLSGFSASTFNGNQWLEIKIGATAPLAPRQPLVSVPYALKANSVPDGSIGATQIANGSLTANKFASGALNTLSWLLGGNSGTNPASQFIGTTDNQPLVFKTNNAERMRLDSAGNLGLGTLTPIARLDIRGGETPVGAPAFIVGVQNGAQGQRAIAGLYATFMNVPADTNARRMADIVAGFNGGAWGTEFLSFHVGNNSSANDAAALTSEKVRITADGSVGIGTATPGAKLDVNGTAQMTGFKLPTGAGPNKVLTSDAAGVGTWNVLTSLLGADSITNAMIQNVDWSKITNAPSSGWSLTGNAGTNPASNYIGTTDNQPLVFKANNQRALRMESVTTVDDNDWQRLWVGNNVQGGYWLNSITPGVTQATLFGGGNFWTVEYISKVTDHGGTVSGGRGNLAGNNNANLSDAAFATVGGGGGNIASNADATISGGSGNIAAGRGSAVGGGAGNVAGGSYSHIGGGHENSAGLDGDAVGGGVGNSARGSSSAVGGGIGNTASGQNSFVGGGWHNTASGNWATVPGGRENSAEGNMSFAAGRHAIARHTGAFVWGDSVDADFASTADNQFNVRASGGIRLFTNVLGTLGVTLLTNDSSWNSVSDRNKKTAFENVDTLDLLERLVAIPITTWNYKDVENPIRHIGPMAQDFFAAFKVGMDDKHIGTIDADGVALAAIQGLNRKLEAKLAVKEQRLQKVETENAELKSRLEALEQAVQRLTAQPK